MYNLGVSPHYLDAIFTSLFFLLALGRANTGSGLGCSAYANSSARLPSSVGSAKVLSPRTPGQARSAGPVTSASAARRLTSAAYAGPRRPSILRCRRCRRSTDTGAGLGSMVGGRAYGGGRGRRRALPSFGAAVRGSEEERVKAEPGWAVGGETEASGVVTSEVAAEKLAMAEMEAAVVEGQLVS